MSSVADQNELFLKQKASAAVTPIPMLPKLADHFIPVKPEHKTAVQNWDNAMEEWRKKLNEKFVVQGQNPPGTVAAVATAATTTTVKTASPIVVSSGPAVQTPEQETDEILAAMNM